MDSPLLPDMKSPFAILTENSTITQHYQTFTKKKLHNRTLHECTATSEEIVSCVSIRMKATKCDIVHCSFDKSELQDTVISRSMIWNSTIRDTTIVDCEVLNCKLINCEIINTPPLDSDQPQRFINRIFPRHLDRSEDEEFRYFPQYVECDFRRCELQNIKMRWSKVNGGSSTYCNLLFSDIQDSKVDKLKGSVGSYFKNCSHDGRLIENQAPLPLTVLPVHVRKPIFSLVTEWNGRQPPLIVALRPETTMYKEALGVLVRDNCFPLKDMERLDELILPNMANKTLISIQQLSVSGFSLIDKKVKNERKVRDKVTARGDMVNCLLEGRKLPFLQSLRALHLTEMHDEHPDEFEARIKAFIELAKRYSLDKLSIKLSYMEVYEEKPGRITQTQMIAYARCETIMNAIIWNLNIQLGILAANNRTPNYQPVEPSLFRHPGYRYSRLGVMWTWQAPKDCKLQWEKSSKICL